MAVALTVAEGWTMSGAESYRLSPEDRMRLIDGVDPDALERFLAAVPEEMREQIRARFMRQEDADSQDSQPGAVVRTADPALRPLLAAVWAPRRRQLRSDPAFNRQVRAIAAWHAPVRVALASLSDPAAIATIWRRSTTDPTDTVLISEAANSHILAAALEELQEDRLQHGRIAQGDRQFHVYDTHAVNRYGPRAQTVFADYYRTLDDFILRLRRSSRTELTGIGEVQNRIFYPGVERDEDYPMWDPRSQTDT